MIYTDRYCIGKKDCLVLQRDGIGENVRLVDKGKLRAFPIFYFSAKPTLSQQSD